MKFKNTILLFICGFMSVSCINLDRPPLNIVGEEDIFGTVIGTESYLARLYTNLPLEDFRYWFTHGDDMFNQTFPAIWPQPDNITGESIGIEAGGFASEPAGTFWSKAYRWIRDVNIMIETLPKYEDRFTSGQFDNYMGQAYFIRAGIYHALAKRYGGVPVVDRVIDYPASVSLDQTMLYRDSEEAVWDFISDDYDRAMSMLPDAAFKGRATRYAAAALKSRAMLHAGSIAKYNTVDYRPVNDIRVCGIPAERAAGYFKQAYDAAKIVAEGGFSLYKGEWVAGDKQAMAQNFINIFLNDTPETIFARYWKLPELGHAFDNAVQPLQTSNGGQNSRSCPTLDFVEMYEFDNKDADGNFDNLDADGHYKLWDSPADAFDGCEPRLAATVILPMSEFKGQTMEIRRGIWTGSGSAADIRPLSADNESRNYGELGIADLALVNTLADNNIENNFVSLNPGSRYFDALFNKTGNGNDMGKMKVAGENGPFTSWGEYNLSGFYRRKYLNPDPASRNNETCNEQPWIEIRYAEVLLNMAEAAWELVSLGQAAGASGEDYLTEATRCINDIRERGGAALLAGNLTSSESDRDVIRTERRKELAFENRIWWDLKRWRILHKEQNNKRYRILMPFYSVADDKYFLDVRYAENRSGRTWTFTFPENYYYQEIEANEIRVNVNCRQNPGY